MCAFLDGLAERWFGPRRRADNDLQAPKSFVVFTCVGCEAFSADLDTLQHRPGCPVVASLTQEQPVERVR